MVRLTVVTRTGFELILSGYRVNLAVDRVIRIATVVFP